MADDMKKEELTALSGIIAEITAANIANTNANYKAVSKTIDNPMTWLMAMGLLFGLIGVMALFIYNTNLDSHESKINGNTQAIHDIQESISKTQTLVQQMQHDQMRISEQIERNSEYLGGQNEAISQIKSTRFKGDDFIRGIQPLEQRISIVEKEQAKRESIISQLVLDFRDLQSQIKHQNGRK
jgi:hypothetical protein